MRPSCWLLILAGLIGPAIGLAQGPSASAPIVGEQVVEAAQIDSAEEKFFESKVRPLLAEHCFGCHGPEKQKAGLRLDSRAAVLKGGESGPAVMPGKPLSSLLIDAINHGEIVQMPPTGKLPVEAIADLTAWVKMGLPWPAVNDEGLRAKDERGAAKEGGDETDYWAFRLVVSPDVPSVRGGDWAQSPIDDFILAQLEANGLQPASAADKPTLIRRVTFDLTGLPPTPSEIAAFLGDDSPDAYGRVVDRLLASPRYGERWGRHWLDVARYADSNGADENRIHANAWRYRDYVVAAFNDGLPFDRFIVEQLAGDLLPAADRETRNRNWVATGFLAIGPKPLLANDAVKVELDVVDEQIDTTGRAFMGLTLGCARCHDHKFDPIPASDYYALAGIFKSTTTIERYDFQNHRTWTERALGDDEDEALHQRLKAAYDQANEDRRLNDEPNVQKKYIAEQRRLRKELAAIPVAMAVREGNIADTRVLVRGNHLTPGPEAQRGFPRVLAGKNQPRIGDDESGRLALAQWLTQPNHPLTARVMVNRLWKWHFGEGIVRSVDNFGRLGERPDNQALLDYLAVRFVESGWSVKGMQRLMVTSAAYQQASGQGDRGQGDPENRFLWHFNRRRLDAEEIRDALLMVSGALDLAMGGAVLPPELNVERVAERGKGQGEDVINRVYQSQRRSLYLPVIRSGLYDLFQAFDFAETSVVTGKRDSTTVAPQALLMMNSELVWEASKRLAGQALNGEHDERARVRGVYELTFGRQPSDTETARAIEFLRAYENELASDRVGVKQGRQRAWEAWCRVILASNEFVYVE